ncbi:MAG: hypothetical protein WC059_01775 [Candidatus Paceibacterota bacterium]
MRVYVGTIAVILLIIIGYLTNGNFVFANQGSVTLMIFWLISGFGHLLDRQDGISLTTNRISVISVTLMATLSFHEMFYYNDNQIGYWFITLLFSFLLNLAIRFLMELDRT